MPGDDYNPPIMRSGEKIRFLTSSHYPGPPWPSHFLTPGLFTLNTGPVSTQLPDLHHVTPQLSNLRQEAAVGVF